MLFIQDLAVHYISRALFTTSSLLCAMCNIHQTPVSAGSKVHKSLRIDHYGEPYGPGDVVGCHIALFEDPALNKMSFYKNGADQGVAYSGVDIPSGIYFPAVSLYMKVSTVLILRLFS